MSLWHSVLWHWQLVQYNNCCKDRMCWAGLFVVCHHILTLNCFITTLKLTTNTQILREKGWFFCRNPKRCTILCRSQVKFLIVSHDNYTVIIIVIILLYHCRCINAYDVTAYITTEHANWQYVIMTLCHNDTVTEWLIEHGFTSAPTQYRLYGRRFLQNVTMTKCHNDRMTKMTILQLYQVNSRLCNGSQSVWDNEVKNVCIKDDRQRFCTF